MSCIRKRIYRKIKEKFRERKEQMDKDRMEKEKKMGVIE
jgi:hypothetical protein